MDNSNVGVGRHPIRNLVRSLFLLLFHSTEYLFMFIPIELNINRLFFVQLQDVESPSSVRSEHQSPENTNVKKNEKALLARVWGNFDSK